MPRPTHYFATRIATIALGTLCGCTEPVFEKLFSTDHFDFYVEHGAKPPCDETGEWLERYYDAYAKFFGVELPPGAKINYHRVRSAETMAWAGCPNATGCAVETDIYVSGPAILPHEIVHANASLLGHPPLLFSEGIAEVLGCMATSDTSGWINTSTPLEDLVESSSFAPYREDLSSHVYPTAASFVRYLLDRFGIEKFLRFYARAQLDATYDETCKIFQNEMGVRLNDALADWRKMPPQLPGDVCLRLMECGPGIPHLTDGEVHPGCGPSGSFLSFQQALFRFHVTEGKTLHALTTPVVTQPQPLTRVSFFRCEGGDIMGRENLTAGFLFDKNEGWHLDPARATRRFTLDVPGGDYVAWFSVNANTAIQTKLESSNPMRRGCIPATEPLTLAENEEVVLTSRWMERACIGFWCPGHSWDVSIGSRGGSIAFGGAVVNGDMPYAPDKVYLCSDPCPTYPDQCEVVMLDPMAPTRRASKQTFAPGTIVHIGAPLAPMKTHFSLHMRLIPPCNRRVPCPDPWHGPR
ncbi:MAG: hypothetical protein IPM54_41320 [Polyangiaceae bacterium]|nr:hypothetical protein [Polyangiaceae bacterium]